MSNRGRWAARRSTTTAHATEIDAIPIGTLISSTQRHEAYCVMTPDSSTPIAPPSRFIADHSAIARWRSGPWAKLAVMIPSEVAAISAPPRPWIPRATISTSLVGARPPSSDAAEKMISAATNVRRWPYTSPTRPASISMPPPPPPSPPLPLPPPPPPPPFSPPPSLEHDRVRVHDPVEVGGGEVQSDLNRRQRDVDDPQVEDDHELRDAADGEQGRLGLDPGGLGAGGGVGRRVALVSCSGGAPPARRRGQVHARKRGDRGLGTRGSRPAEMRRPRPRATRCDPACSITACAALLDRCAARGDEIPDATK